MLLIVFLMLIGGILESLGVSLVLPVLKIVVEPNVLEKNALLGNFAKGMGITTTSGLAIFFLAALVATFVVKNLFLYYVNVVQLRFVFTNQFATSRRMMVNFMKRPYEYYLNADTTVIQRSITSDVINMYGLIMSFLQLSSESIVFLCLLAILLIEDAAMTVSIATVLLLTLLLIKIVIKPVMTRAGEENQEFYSGLYKWISEAVTGIKEIKIGAKEDYFIHAYATCGEGYVNAVQKYNLFNSTPRMLIETVAIAAMVLYLIVKMESGVAVKDLIPQLGVMVAAAARLLPSASRINNHLTAIAYFEPFLMNVSDSLQEEINDASINYDPVDYQKREQLQKLPITKEIALEGITYGYPQTQTKVLDKASLQIPVGKSVGIVGTTGAGKTTIVDVLLGLLQPEEGSITADGISITDNYPAFLKNVGYIPQSIFMLDGSIRRNVAFGIADEQVEEEKVWAALREAHLDDFVRSLPEGLDTGIGERGIRLSGGQRQRIGIARALYDDPEVLVMDEATSALDTETEAAVMESINRLHGKKTLIIIAHRLQTIEQCDIVYRIEQGKAMVERE